MKFRKLVLLSASLGLAATALANEDATSSIAIAVAGHEMGDETRVMLNSEELGFDLHDMQVGENRSVVDASGRNILITREVEGFKFDIDGKEVAVPLFEGGHTGAVWLGDAMAHEDVQVHVMSDMSTATAPAMEDVMIFSGKPIDDATQQAIKTMLEAAGHGSDVRFVDRESSMGGMHGVKVIEKRVEITP